MSRPVANKDHIITLDDVDGCWNNAFSNFWSRGQVDGQESSSYDESDLGDDVATIHNEVQMVAY